MKRKIVFSILLGIILSSSENIFSQANLDSLKHILATSKDEEVLAYTYNDYAFQFYFNQPDTAIFYAEKALEIAQRLKLNSQIYSAYNVMGLTYQIIGKYQLALDYFNKELPYIGGNNIDLAKVHHNMGITYRRMQNNQAALEVELKAAKFLEDEKDSLSLATIYLSIANIYRDLADFDLAEKYILNALDIINKPIKMGMQNPKSMLGNCYSSYGNLMQVKGDLNKAIEYHKKAIQLYTEANDVYNNAISYENLGDDYTILQQYADAINNYSVAKELMRQLNSISGVGYENYKIADAYSLSKNYIKAHIYADSALISYTGEGSDADRADVYELKYQIFDAEGNADSALAFYKKFNALKDSLSVESQKAEVLRLKEEFETTQKEQQIALLETSNALKDKEKQQQSILKNIAIVVIVILLVMGFLIWNRNRIKQQVKQLQMRNNIAIDLHDEVGSSLSSIKMLSEIAALQKGDKNQLDDILQKINTNAKETAEKMHDIIWMINPKHDQLENILQRMEKFIFEMCSPHNIQFEFRKNIQDNIKLNMQQRKDILLIFKEAVNNAVKYSAAKKITADISQQDHQIKLTIQDDGNGFDINKIQPGNGLDSMKMRTNELNGTIEILSQLQKGTEITVRIPL